jgi:hypothetical protein
MGIKEESNAGKNLKRSDLGRWGEECMTEMRWVYGWRGKRVLCGVSIGVVFHSIQGLPDFLKI